MRSAATALIVCLAASLSACSMLPEQLDPAVAAVMTPKAFAGHVNFLADPKLGGRVAGTDGNRVAREYIAAQFRQAGLTPAGDAGTFFQAFTNDRLRTPADGCDLRFAPPPTTSQPAIVGRCGRDFAPSAQGKLGAFSAPLVFAGYGAHNRIRGYNDYESLSARGAVVMILAGEPHNAAGQSRWALHDETTGLADLPYKLRLAREQGAVAALVVAPPALMPADDIDDVLGDCTGALPAIRITRAFADRLLATGGENRTIEQLVSLMHRTRRPASFAIGGLASGKIALTEATCHNVLGVLKPDGPDDGRVVLIGAHYDHLPATGQLAKDDRPGVRPGADDNASGVSTMLLLSRALAATRDRRSTFVFAAFDSEDEGFFGSRYYVRHPAFPLERMTAMVNIDQVGRIGWRGVLVLGSTLDPSVGGPVKGAGRASLLPVARVPVTSARQWSDQAPFVRTGVPTLFIYGYRPPEYHTCGDTADLVNASNGAAVARLIYGIVREIGAR
ncbi:MAG: M28 family peptidase [Phycisphaerae bacterium]|nr:M28 family peptidase [Phycisphaerae bacterium]